MLSVFPFGFVCLMAAARTCEFLELDLPAIVWKPLVDSEITEEVLCGIHWVFHCDLFRMSKRSIATRSKSLISYARQLSKN